VEKIKVKAGQIFNALFEASADLDDLLGPAKAKATTSADNNPYSFPHALMPSTGSSAPDQLTRPRVLKTDKNTINLQEKLSKKLILLPTTELGEGRNVSDFAADLGRELKDLGVFVKDDVVVEARTNGMLSVMDPPRFCTWVEQHVSTCDVKNLRKTMNTQQAALVLQAQQFQSQLRRVWLSLLCGSPAWDEAGGIRLVPGGYDVATQSLITGPDDYTGEISSVEEAREFITGLYEECSFTSPSGRAVAVASLLTPYCLLLLDPQESIPCFGFTANAKRAGKTTLAKLSLLTTIGSATITSWPEGAEAAAEIAKTLFAASLAGSQYVLFDNIERKIRSSMLAALVTGGGKTRGRILGGHCFAELSVPRLIFITGNKLNLHSDIRDRFLLCEQTLDQTGSPKKWKRPLTSATILSLRRRTLAALWWLVKSWADAGRPAGPDWEERYGTWQRVVGGIVVHNGFGNPAAEEPLKHSPGSHDEEMSRTIAAMVPGREYALAEVVEIWHELDLFRDKLAEIGETDLEEKSREAASFKSWAGKALRSAADGRTWAGRNLLRIPGAQRKVTWKVVPADLKAEHVKVEGCEANLPF
jgi:hypothetical protein